MRKNVSFADNDCKTDEGAVLDTGISDMATREARVPDRVSARLSALRLAAAWL